MRKKKKLNSEFVWWLCSVFSVSTWFVLVLMWRVDFYDDVFMYLGQIFLVSCFLSRFHRICFKFLLDLQSKKFFLLFSRFERFKKLCVNKHVKLKSCLSHLTVQHLTSDLCFLSVCEVGDRLDRRRRVSRGITVFISECLREKALNQTGRVTLTLNGRKRERERSIGLN